MEAVSGHTHRVGLRDENAELREKVARQASELTSLRIAIEQRNSELRCYKQQSCRLARDMGKLRDQCDHMRNMLEDLWPRAAFTMTNTNKETWLAELQDVGAEVDE